jgi:rubrerythrin
MSMTPAQRAVLEALQAERDAMYFYLRAARYAKNGRARRIFEKLATEERQHVEYFFEVYHGAEIPDLGQFLDSVQATPWLDDLEELISTNGDDLLALELALRKEQNLEIHLRRTAETIADPQVRRVYEVNADSTHQHYQAIAAELERLRAEAPER